jgi:filamentous hemagglutinin family protein
MRTRPHTRTRRADASVLRLTAICVGVALAFGSVPLVRALPLGEDVRHGDVTVTRDAAGTGMTITQATPRGIVRWDSYSIGRGEMVSIEQPGAQSVLLNRVVGGTFSDIQGRLTSNGQVFLVNPAGIFFGPTATVNVGGLVASTLDLSEEDFVSGRYRFANIGEGRAARLEVAKGALLETSGSAASFIALLGGEVVNGGVVVAKMGTAAMASGNAITLDVAGDGLTRLRIDSGAFESIVANNGAVIADGGQVILTAGAFVEAARNVVSSSGTIQAHTLSQREGRIVLESVFEGDASVTGAIDASGTTPGTVGGSVTVTGNRVAITGTIDARGDAGGGRVTVGGERGIGDGVRTAAVFVGADASIDASTVEQGSGGSIIIDSGGLTGMHGSLASRGGVRGGNGGVVRTSGREVALAGARVDASATLDRAGAWIAEADAFEIRSGSPAVPAEPVFAAPGAVSTVPIAVLQDALNTGTEIGLQTNGIGTGTIFWEGGAGLSKVAGADASLLLRATDDIRFGPEAAIRSTAGILHLDLQSDFGPVVLFPGTVMETNGGGVSISGGGGQPSIMLLGDSERDVRIDTRRLVDETAGGDVQLRGRGPGGLEPDVMIVGTQVDTGSGRFSISARRGSAGEVRIGGSDIRTGTGGVTIAGESTVGGIGVRLGAESLSDQEGGGVRYARSSIETQSGDVRIEGRAELTGGEAVGVLIEDARLQTGSGRIDIVGEVSQDFDAEGGSIGIQVLPGIDTRSEITSETGTVFLSGIVAGDGAANLSRGVHLESTRVFAGGAVSIIGRAGTAVNAVGTLLAAGDMESDGETLHTTVETVSGTVTIEGSAALTPRGFGAGVRLAGASVSSTQGDIALRGAAVQAPFAFASGVEFTGFGDLRDEVAAGGTRLDIDAGPLLWIGEGTRFVKTGVATTTLSAVSDGAIWLDRFVEMTAETGRLNIDLASGRLPPPQNEPVRGGIFVSYGTRIATGGGDVRLRGAGPDGAAGFVRFEGELFEPIAIDTTTPDGSGGSVSMLARGGGIALSATDVRAGGNVQLDGTGGAHDDAWYGVLLAGASIFTSRAGVDIAGSVPDGSAAEWAGVLLAAETLGAGEGGPRLRDASIHAGGGNIDVTGTVGHAAFDAAGIGLTVRSERGDDTVRRVTLRTDTGSISLTGTAAGSDFGNVHGIRSDGAQLTSAGQLTLTGTAGDTPAFAGEGEGPAPASIGVALSGFGALTAERLITARTTARISGTSGRAPGASAGVSIDQITLLADGIDVEGIGAGSDVGSSAGVSVRAATLGASDGDITIAGTGGNGRAGEGGSGEGSALGEVGSVGMRLEAVTLKATIGDIVLLGYSSSDTDGGSAGISLNGLDAQTTEGGNIEIAGGSESFCAGECGPAAGVHLYGPGTVVRTHGDRPGRIRVTGDARRGFPIYLDEANLGGPDQRGTIVLRASAGGTARGSVVIDGALIQTTGIVNLRPGAVSSAASGDATDVPIEYREVERPAAAALADVDPMVITPDVLASISSSAPLVIGSDAHRGQISVEAPLAWAGPALTLQNAGAGSEGIRLDQPVNVGERRLALVSAGAVRQGEQGAITAGRLALRGFTQGADFDLGMMRVVEETDPQPINVVARMAAYSEGGGVRFANLGTLDLSPVTWTGIASATDAIVHESIGVPVEDGPVDSALRAFGAAQEFLIDVRGGDLLLDPDIVTTDEGSSIALGSTGLFQNYANGALRPGAGGRWLVGSASWEAEGVQENRGGLLPGNTMPNVYGCGIGEGCVPDSGDHFVYRQQPLAVVDIGSGVQQIGEPEPLIPVEVRGALTHLGDSADDVAAGQLFIDRRGVEYGLFTVGGEFVSPANYSLQVDPGTLHVAPRPPTTEMPAETASTAVALMLPHICAGTGGIGGATAEGEGTEAVDQEWSRVRQRLMLNSCAGVRAREACSDF